MATTGRGVVAGLLAGLLAVTGCSSGSDEGSGSSATSPEVELVEAGVLRIGVTGPFARTPAAAVPTDQGQMIAADLLFDGLTAIDPATSRAVPSLAEEWEVSDDLTTWTFRLREDAVFSDGSPVTGADVKASLERAATQGASSLIGSPLDVVVGHEAWVEGEAEDLAGITLAEDGTAVTIETAGPFASLAEVLGSPLLGVAPAAGAGSADAVVGSGPLMAVGPEGDQAAFADGPDEARDALALVPAPGRELGFDGAVLFRFDDVEASYEAFVDGALDWSLVPADEVDAAREEFGEAAFHPFHAEFFYGFNLADPVYQDRSFRAAIVRAVDREALVAEHFPAGVALNGTVVSTVPGFEEDPCGEPCAYDPEVAEALLAVAFPDGEVPTVTLDFYEGERELAVATDIAEALEAVGIPVDLHPVDEGYETFVTSGEQEIFLFGWVGLVPLADAYLAPLFLTGSPDNVTAFSSEVVDLALAAARGGAEEDERVSAYQAAEATIMDQVPVLPLVQVTTTAVVSGAVEGWQPQLDGTFVVEDVRL